MTPHDEPAFPCLDSNLGGLTLRHSGMSMRTAIAAQILAGKEACSIAGTHHAPDNAVAEAITLTDLLLSRLSSTPSPAQVIRQRDELLAAAKQALDECVDLIATPAGDALTATIAKIEGGAA